MKTKTILLTLFLLASAHTQVLAGDGTIMGTIKFEGTAPEMKVIPMSADAKCEANNKGKTVKAETLVLGQGMTMANVLVRVKSGLAAGQTFDKPTEPVVIDQIGCMYVPRVVAGMAGQGVKFLNSDGTMHNVHGLSKVNAEFNISMPAFKKEHVQNLAQVEDPFTVKCDVHPWMKGTIAVMSHPYFSVTKDDGAYTIKGLEPGDYEIEIWHEKLGIQTAKVTVAAGESKTLDFTLQAPAQVSQLEAIMIVR